MKNINIISSLLSIMLCAGMMSVNAKAQNADVIMSPSQLKQAGLDKEVFLDAFYRHPDGYCFVATDKRIYLLGMNGMTPVLTSDTKMTDFNFANNIILAVCGDRLCCLDEKGGLSECAVLPHEDMKVRYGKDNIYLFDTEPKDGKYSLMMIKGSDAGIVNLCDAPVRVTDVMELGDWLVFSAGNMIARVSFADRKIVPIFRLPDENETILSVIYDEDGDDIYFSSDKAVYRTGEKNVECISDKSGGLLCDDPFGVIVFDPDKKVIFRLRDTVLRRK